MQRELTRFLPSSNRLEELSRLLANFWEFRVTADRGQIPTFPTPMLHLSRLKARDHQEALRVDRRLMRFVKTHAESPRLRVESLLHLRGWTKTFLGHSIGDFKFNVVAHIWVIFSICKGLIEILQGGAIDKLYCA